MSFQYESMVQKALLGVVREVLIQVSKNGLEDKNHFYVTFKTKYPGVVIPKYLLEEYPDEITVVLQHEFWDLKVYNDNFTATLCFSDMHEKVSIPFNALTNFVDPSVKFGLQFEVDETLAIEESVSEESITENESTENKEEKDDSDGKVITLDQFRKK
jgi:hypothetical protein